ncbi:hypothetical protein BROUX41_001400 [Berkeleyomyces rouxiae]|uniref:uncharacterized protein n=1 Tax=Berkeleyomyces rouxiae TaxID=2035830 RepID=UPI003B79CE9B
MSKSASSSAAQASKEAGAASDAASHYGTRSRNRHGNNRPNYAEDSVDMDFEYSHDTKKDDPKKPSRNRNSSPAVPQDAFATSSTSAPASASASAPTRSSSSRKSNAANGDSGRGPHQESTKDHNTSAASTPSNSSDRNTTSQPPSKKRKTASSSSSASNVQSNPQLAKRAHAIVQNSGARPLVTYPDSNMMSFTNTKALLQKDGSLVADDGTELRQNDHVYLVSEPPGEPYYLGRVMEFMHAGNDTKNPIDAIRVNWYYRPKDIGKRVQDTRLLLATMHSDVSPLSTIRGKCHIMHKSEIASLEEYKKTPDSFWYERLYDRYIQKHYDLIPTDSIINVPERVKRVLDEHWKFVLVEQGRGRELTAAMKLCKKCGGYCASNDSVDCSDCKITWHMNCVSPPVMKKPSRGFGWSCAPCSRRHEKMINARHTPVFGNTPEIDDEDLIEEEEDPTAATKTSSMTPSVAEDARQEPTAEQKQQASLWPFRYLGAHCKVEDALDLDDRIYPRTSTRIGPRHQATVLPYPGRPVEYEKPLELKKPGRREPRLTKEQLAEFEAKKLERENRPAWLQDEPPGYTARGENYDNDDPRCTATLLWKPPTEQQISSARLTSFMNDARDLCSTVDVPENSTNLQDVALNSLFISGFDTKEALQMTLDTDIVDFKEPRLSPSEMKKFEEGVGKFGSELALVSRYVKTVEHKHIVRLYYTWKKTQRGKEVWGNYAGRKSKKEAKAAAKTVAKLQDDIADNVDDSAYDCEKATKQKRSFVCKFCTTKKSRQWRRAPNGGPTDTGKGSRDKNNQYVTALCRRCAELWRRYAIQWEDIEEVAKKIAQSGGRAWKRKQDEELLKELVFAKDIRSPEPPVVTTNGSVSKATVANGAEQPPRKKLKSAADEKSLESSPAPSTQSKKKDKEKGKDKDKEREKEKEKDKEKEKEATEKEQEKVKSTPAPEKLAATPAPATADIPKPKPQPCAVCSELNDTILTCKECRLPVHPACYGVLGRSAAKASKCGRWTCDTCINDRSPQVSLDYRCVLCPLDTTTYDFVGVPEKTSRKKDKADREQAKKAAEYYSKKQEENGRPADPREALKRTADNNWIHITCAALTPELQFGNTETLVPVEGVASIPRARFDRACGICNIKTGACVDCDGCNQSFHVECARRKPNRFFVGFTINSVKSTRRGHHNIVTVNGETGVMSPFIWCLSHEATPPSMIGLHDQIKGHSVSALQFYIQNYKQADLTLTGNVRKATVILAASKASSSSFGRRLSATASESPTTNTAQPVTADSPDSVPESGNCNDKVCAACGIDVSPRWWPIDEALLQELAERTDEEPAPAVGDEAKKFVEQRKFRCHKCYKLGKTPQKNITEPEPDMFFEEVSQAKYSPPPPVPASIVAPGPPMIHQPNMFAMQPAPIAPERPAQLASPRIAPPPLQQQPEIHHSSFQAWAPPTAPVHRPAPSSPPGPPASRDRYYPMIMPPFGSNEWNNEYRSHRGEPPHCNDSGSRPDPVHRPATEHVPMHNQRYNDPAPAPPPQMQHPSSQQPVTLASLRPPPLPIPASQPSSMAPVPQYPHAPPPASMPPAPSYHHSYASNLSPVHHHSHPQHHHGHNSHINNHPHQSHPHPHAPHAPITHNQQHPPLHHSPHGSMASSGPPRRNEPIPMVSLHPQRPPAPPAPAPAYAGHTHTHTHSGSPLGRDHQYAHYSSPRDRASGITPLPIVRQQPQDGLGRPTGGHSANASISPSLKNLLS